MIRANRALLLCFAALLVVSMVAAPAAATPPLGGPIIDLTNRRMNFYCFGDTISVGFAVVGLGDDPCRLWLESDLPINHTLDTETEYTSDGNYGSCKIKVLEPPEEQRLPRNPGYDSFQDYQYAYIYLKGDHNVEKTIIVINTQYGLFAGITNEEALFYYACDQIKEWEETLTVLAVILTVVLVVSAVGIARTVIKRRKARGRFSAAGNSQDVVKESLDHD